jgi:hypothetical protein
MKMSCCAGLLCLCAWEATAEIVEFDLSPPGQGNAPGLAPGNEIIPGQSNGSGGEVGRGVFFDTATRQLTLSIGYGSSTGFADLTAPAFSWLLHGPAISSETAPAMFDLAPLHTFATDQSRGGTLFGALTLTPVQVDGLLAGLDYINIYTPANLGGEIRGQLVVVPEPSVLRLGYAALIAMLALSRLRHRIQARFARGTGKD